MKVNKNDIKYSPSDLNNFVNCKYHIFNDLIEDEQGLIKKKPSEDIKLLRRFGDEHEAKHLKLFQKKYKKNITIDPKLDDQIRYEKTIQAIKDGYDLIYKAFFIDKNFRGETDFLIKTKEKSKIGEYNYDVYDTKITRNLKPSHVLQITGYSHLVSKLTGSLPNKMFLIDGTDKVNEFKVNEFYEYFSYTKLQFDEFLKSAKKKNLYPEKCKHCDICNWKDVCQGIWDSDNYVNQVANIIKSQIVKFKLEGIDTVDKLAGSDPNKIKAKINPATKIRLCNQAKLQEEKRLTSKSKCVFIEQQEGKGFYKIPRPNDGDLFFDIEGFPDLSSRNLEYLHGLYFKENKSFKFKSFFLDKPDRDGEFKIFKEFILFLKERLTKFPDAFIYHYNNYETTALKNLASEYSSIFPEGNNFIDNLLRTQKFVDLYRVVQHTLQTSEKGISLKDLEKFYRKDREANIKTATESVSLFDNWASTKDKKIKQDIIDYNEEDCISTHDLRNFLLENKPKHIPWFENSKVPLSDKELEALKKPGKKKGRSVEEIEKEEIQLIKALSKRDKNNIVTNNLIDLVGFHRREAKPDSWAYYGRLEKTHEELLDDAECLANCNFVKKTEDKKTGEIKYIYNFETQNYKVKEGSYASEIFLSKNFGKIGKITENDDDDNLIEIISKPGKEEPPEIFTFGPAPSPKTDVIQGALTKFMKSYCGDNPLHFKCGIDILENTFPDILNIKKGDPIIDNNKNIVSEVIRAVKDLNSSYLLIQGPPGAGKTYTSAKIILDLIKNKKRVGVTSNSHKAINNLLSQIEELAIEEKFTFKGFKKSSKPDDKLNGKIIDDLGSVKKDYDYTNQLFAGTAWLFSDARLNQKIDYLFVDEAGQVSLANTLAMSTSTKNIILIGDQMQLSQPIKGTHAGDTGKSSLEYLLSDYDTIPTNKGIFLDKTRRLNYKICDYISDSFYDSRLKPHEITKERHVKLQSKSIKDEGISFVSMNHLNCSQKSDEEVKEINSMMKAAIGKSCKDSGTTKERKINLEDILIVAPFNMQVNNLSRNLPKGSKVGTIDKFQGQEAKVVFISMTSSDPENLPRHKEFFFSRNRLNVAVSRAQCSTVILFNPSLLNASCSKINEMRLVNNFCKLLKFKINK